jgi:hypothetical protein
VIHVYQSSAVAEAFAAMEVRTRPF